MTTDGGSEGEFDGVPGLHIEGTQIRSLAIQEIEGRWYVKVKDPNGGWQSPNSDVDGYATREDAVEAIQKFVTDRLEDEGWSINTAEITWSQHSTGSD